MSGKKLWKPFFLLAAGVSCFLFPSCDHEKIVNSGNMVTVSGHVFLSPAQRIGVPDITVVIEKGEDSSSEAVFADKFIRTDENGRWEARFSLSFPGGSGVMDITPVYVEESMRLLFISPEKGTLDLGSGFTFQAGKEYNIWDVFLSDFTTGD